MNETDEDTLCRSIVETVGDAVIFADREGNRLMEVIRHKCAMAL